MEYKNKNVLVTGAGSGIGRETAKLFGQQGAKVIVADIDASGGEDTVKQIINDGGEAFFIKTDVSDYAQVQRLLERSLDQYGSVDIAVNNAGVANKKPQHAADVDIEDWDRVMSINTSGVFYCMKEELKQMMLQKGGCIINIASIAGLRGLPNSLAYVASKHAVVGMTKTAAMEYAKHNIRVNAVCPVFTVTPMFQPEAMDEISEGLSEKLKRAIPMKRFAQPREMAEAILWLSSDKASFVTGHALPVDGGLTA